MRAAGFLINHPENDMNAREDFLRARRAGIGGSDIAALLGLSPWRTPVDVYLDKTAAELPAEEQSEPAYWGTVLEDVVAHEFQKRTGRRVQRVSTTLQHPQHAWMRANIDRAIVAPGSRARLDKDGRLAGAEGVLEVKTASAYKAAEWAGPDGSDALPVYYTAQCMWYLAVTGLDVCDVAVLIGGQHYAQRRVERDDETIRGLIDRAEAFWLGNVLAGIPPEPATGAEAAALFARDNGQMREIGGNAELLEAFNTLHALRAQQAEIDQQVDAITDTLKVAIGEHAGLSLDGRPVATWKAAKDSRVTDWKAVAMASGAHPDCIAHHTTTKAGARRFLLSK